MKSNAYITSVSIINELISLDFTDRNKYNKNNFSKWTYES
ncbi:hypothetical protein LMG8526_2037 [Lactococcus lactis subsp. lactis]|nr:hypothetical protein LMG8526_2037 [Lactococcus lactis subsp. lactis]